MRTVTHSLNDKGRIVGLDAMRAILALFGILMHSGVSYMVLFPGFDILWYGFSQQASLGFNWLVLWIHSFYMPAFFFLSGFLSYKIYKNHHLSGLALSRLTRIALPFLVIYLTPIILGAVISLFVQDARHINVWQHVLATLKDTSEFWFLYYLFLMDLAALFILSVAKLLKNKLGKLFQTPARNKLFNIAGLAFFLILPIALLLYSSNWFVPVKTSIIPNANVLTYYATFFALGWIIQHQYHYLVTLAKHYWPSLLLISILGISANLYCLLYYPYSELARMLGVVAYSLSALGMFLALLGFCLTILRQYNPVIQYVSDSSYWLYISQIPIVLFVESMLINVHLSLIYKYVMTVLITVGSCLLLYQIIIRKRKLFNYIDCRPKHKPKEVPSIPSNGPSRLQSKKTYISNQKD